MNAAQERDGSDLRGEPRQRMNLLLVVCDYPHPGHLFAGAFYENSARALRELGHHVEVLAVQPYAPPVLSKLVPRWRVYAGLPASEIRNGITVRRPRNVQLPRIAGAFSVGAGAFMFCRRTALEMHRRSRFDAILSFDLQQTGGLAWRLGGALGLPSAGWATGGDMRFHAASPHGRVVLDSLRHLDLVFYQSRELFEIAAGRLGAAPERMEADKHMVLARGIPAAPEIDRAAARRRVRESNAIGQDDVVILNVGRVCRDKGVFELVEAIAQASARDSRIVCVQVGSMQHLDEAAALQKEVRRRPGLSAHFRFLPACDPEQIWEYLSAADVFAFTSHHEGMPNSLLEAMAFGVPCVAFGIPPVCEIDGGTGCLALVPPFDSSRFADNVLSLAADDSARERRVRSAQDQVSSRFMITTNLSIAAGRLAARANAAR